MSQSDGFVDGKQGEISVIRAVLTLLSLLELQMLIPLMVHIADN
jgi:hypothetical protein